jgi:hypothetical protein
MTTDMKKALIAVTAATGLAACTSVDTATVSSSELVTSGGEAVAVVQGTAVGFTLLFHIVDLVQADLDTAVNNLIIKEAKAMGASRVDLKSASTTPRHGVFAIFGPPLGLNLIGFPMSSAQGVAVK